MYLLEQNLDKINWVGLSFNSNAIHLLKDNFDKINWYYISINNNIFDYNYDAIKEKISIFKEELIQESLHPKRLIYWLNNNFYDF